MAGLPFLKRTFRLGAPRPPRNRRCRRTALARTALAQLLLCSAPSRSRAKLALECAYELAQLRTLLPFLRVCLCYHHLPRVVRNDVKDRT